MSTNDDVRFNFAGATIGAGATFGQTGGRNKVRIGDASTRSTALPPAAVRDLEIAVAQLRGVLSREDQEIVDQNVATVKAAGSDRSTARSALNAIAGVASLVGGVGAPVVLAVKALMSALSS